ncbi:MAG: hypothetical protein RJA07_2259 [Bacteroidota bacterium]|jgi:gliding motility-associated lipoprotein GldB
MKLKYLIVGLIAVCWLSISGCSCNNAQKKIDEQVATIKVSLKINRFDNELFECNKQNNFALLQKKYPTFFKMYIEQILQIGKLNDSVDLKLKMFCNNKSIASLHDTVQKYYIDFSPYQIQLQKAFQYHKYYFPQSKIPSVYTFISEFGYGVITTDSTLAIGLDMFLGEQYPYYVSLGFPNFIIQKCNAKNIVPSAMKAWGQSLIPENNSRKKLIDRMINAGKTMYYLDKVLPQTPDSIKIGYSTIQLMWCEYNEFKIWEYFVKHNLLYSTDMMEVSHYIGDSPVTPGMPPDAPGNIGTWVGWQIVKEYMDRNPNLSVQQLMNETDGQKILEQSKYKPKKK